MEDTDGMELDSEMMASMGFAAFGSQPNSKRRKYNHDDAIVEGSPSTSRPKENSQNPTGANSTVLGIRQQYTSRDQGQQSPQRIAEGGISSVDTAQAAAINRFDTLEERRDSQEVTASVTHIQFSSSIAGDKQKPPAIATGLAAYLTRGQEKQSAPMSGSATDSLIESAATSLPAAHSSLPPKQFPTATQGPLSQEELQALRRGVRNERGDVAYFLPSFVEDPWKGLLKRET